MPEKNGQKVRYEHRLTTLEVKVDSILDNHLPHLQKAVDANGKRTWAILITVIFGIIIQIAFNTI